MSFFFPPSVFFKILLVSCLSTSPICCLPQPWTVPLACTSGGSRDFLLVPERSVIQRLEMETGCSLGPLEGHYGAVTALTYSGARMALTSGDRSGVCGAAENCNMEISLATHG